MRLPVKATANSSCLDVSTYTPLGTYVEVWDSNNNMSSIKIKEYSREGETKIGFVMNPGDVAVVPTGLNLDIPSGYDVKLYPRSGNSFKRKLNISNCVARIDEDYVEELMILLQNNSKTRLFIEHHERVVQMECVKTEKFLIQEISEKPKIKTNRVGGLGHSGQF